ncbi:transposable element Tcb1 transposase [Trichonephila clavipes]|nr:transposable element Tcb1 transposase [Trichonephila clavipes]
MECHSESVEALGNNAPPYRSEAWWVGMFQQGLVSTSDDQSSGRPVSLQKNWSTHRTLPTFHPVNLILFPKLMTQYVIGGLLQKRTLLMQFSNRIITHILKKNVQITENHQMAQIVRQNDESVREGYIRNGGKEVRLFTSALKAFQCNNRIVIAQKKHLDDFLCGRIIGRLECGGMHLEVAEDHGIA